MGQTAENLAYQFDISREAMDAYALRSHARAVNASDQRYDQEEMALLTSLTGKIYQTDTGVRSDCTRQKLAKLRAIFDRYGLVTAGNSSQVTDGAVMVLLASADAVRRHKLPVLAKISAASWCGVDPALMGLGPVHSIAHLLKQKRQGVSSIDLWEINEAFAAQVLACQKVMADKSYCQKTIGLRHALEKFLMIVST